VRLTGTWEKLYHIDDKHFSYVLPDPDVSGVSSMYRTIGYQKIQIYPAPDASTVSANTSVTYEYYSRLTTALSGDSDTSGLPEMVEPVVLDLAESYGQSYAKDQSESQRAFQRFIQAVQKLWIDNSEMLRIQARDIPAALNIGQFEQVTKTDRS
jgi:hypothetical protein